VAVLALSLPLCAAPPQGARINIGEVDHLEEKADEVVSVNLDGESLDLGRKFLAVRDGVTVPVKELAKGLKGIYLRTFRFGRKEAYTKEDTDGIRRQVQGPGWVPMINVKDRNKAENVSVYSFVENEEVTGVTVISEEANEYTVVNIVGPVDLSTLSELGKEMGMPAMKIATTELPRKKVLPPKPAVPPANQGQR
jgi:hypothetical protein